MTASSIFVLNCDYCDGLIDFNFFKEMLDAGLVNTNIMKYACTRIP